MLYAEYSCSATLGYIRVASSPTGVVAMLKMKLISVVYCDPDPTFAHASPKGWDFSCRVHVSPQ